MVNYYNKRVNPRNFQVGDLVLMSSAFSRPPSELKMLSPIWKGPYIFTKVVQNEAYRLAQLYGKSIKILRMRCISRSIISNNVFVKRNPY